MEELARSLWDKRSLPPGWLFDRTPAELFFLFAARDDEPDPVDELRRWNLRAAARGEMPQTPRHIMPEVPRRGRRK